MRAPSQAIAIAISTAALGCGSAETTDGPAQATPPGQDAGGDAAGSVCVNVDPSVAGPDDACGIFVSSSLGSDENAGTLERPVRTMSKALALALEGSKRVYACAEVFHEAVEIPAGIELWGGLDCANGWAYAGPTKKTTIAPEPDVIPLRFLSGEGRSGVIDVRAEAADAVQPGGSSIAALVLPGAAVEFTRSELAAGNGAAGAAGEQGGGPGAPFQLPKGADGLPGGDACDANFVPGGAAVVTVCESVESIGGKGGNGRLTYGEDGEDGQPVPQNPDGLKGQGGYGQNGNHTQCMSGHVGNPGKDGEHGLGAAGPGWITVAGWEGENGQNGGDGLPGQGGGGGGGVRGPLYNDCGPNQPQGGASGGSGGAGGCGGKGGKGGGSGGASIGLLSLSVDVTIRATMITTAEGGDGGRGGLWQGGGPGGTGGAGGVGWWSGPGCYGGEGGKGGNGGHGGGGLGGPSVGIAHMIDHPVTLEDVTISTGNPGRGGPGGSQTVTLPGTAGVDGLEGDVLSFPAQWPSYDDGEQDDSSHPYLSGCGWPRGWSARLPPLRLRRLRNL